MGILNNMKKIYFFIGTSAEYIKLAPVIKELKKRNLAFKIITSGQTKVRFKDLFPFTGEVIPSIMFQEKKNKASSIHFLFWAVKAFFIALIKLKRELKGCNKDNTYLIIHGDTVTSTIGAFIGFLYQVRLVHIEAGYRSFNFFEPFPEEICRTLNIHLADLLFSPTDWAKKNVKKMKGIKVSTHYNTNIETLQWAAKQKSKIKSITKQKKYYLLILHRQEHVIFRKEWTRDVMDFVIKNADKNLTCFVLNHPLTLNIIKSLDIGSRAKNIQIIPPLPYPEFISLMKNAEFIASDGASFQQETYFLGKPLLILRNFTEQTEGLKHNAVLYQDNKEVITNFLNNYKKFEKKPITFIIPPSKIVVDYLVKH
jgi:UDP-N-acetylglucosamine 2-epimerase (non-hydrolysing)